MALSLAESLKIAADCLEATNHRTNTAFYLREAASAAAALERERHVHPPPIQGSESSSALMTGPVRKHLGLFTARREDSAHMENLPATLARIQMAITDYFKLTLYTPPELEVNPLDSSTLQLTLRWPGASTLTPATLGSHGHVDHDI